MNKHRVIRILAVIAGLITLQPMTRSQSFVEPYNLAAISVPLPSSVTADVPGPIYARPGPRAKLNNYLLDSFGPYPIAVSLLVAAYNQAENTPPEWGQGPTGYGKRFGSVLGIEATSQTTRYGLAESFREDTLYYRCECRAVFPRLRHALTSTLTGRSGSDGHRVFSIPSLVAPYAGTMTAVYGWYPSRFNAKDAFRMGNYNLLGMAGENISMEFFPRRPHSLLFRLHFSNRNAAPAPGKNP